MKHITIATATLQFLKQLAQNNNREWFQDHKNKFLDAQENMGLFVDQLIVLMNRHDTIENVSGKKSLYRIYSDVRFKKDKSPYQKHFAFGLRRATKQKRGGYFMKIQPGSSYLACGFFAPNPEDLYRIRKDIEWNNTGWTKVLNDKKIKKNFGTLQGQQLATAPRGFGKDLDGIERIRHKQFILRHDFTDQELLAPDFLIKVNALFQSVRPFFDYMSEVLTTNANGESII
jgi:uncharacterized protein (TIGR02453 family)